MYSETLDDKDYKRSALAKILGRDKIMREHHFREDAILNRSMMTKTYKLFLFETNGPITSFSKEVIYSCFKNKSEFCYKILLNK